MIRNSPWHTREDKNRGECVNMEKAPRILRPCLVSGIAAFFQYMYPKGAGKIPVTQGICFTLR